MALFSDVTSKVSAIAMDLAAEEVRCRLDSEPSVIDGATRCHVSTTLRGIGGAITQIKDSEPLSTLTVVKSSTMALCSEFARSAVIGLMKESHPFPRNTNPS